MTSRLRQANILKSIYKFRKVSSFAFCNIYPLCVALKTSLGQCVPNTGSEQCSTACSIKLLVKSVSISDIGANCGVQYRYWTKKSLTVMFETAAVEHDIYTNKDKNFTIVKCIMKCEKRMNKST